MLSGMIHLLFLDKELIIKDIFMVIGSGLISGFLYAFFKKCNFRKYEETINMFIFTTSLIQGIFVYFIGRNSFLSLIYLIIFVIYFINDKECRFGYFLLYLLVSSLCRTTFSWSVFRRLFADNPVFLYFLLVVLTSLEDAFLYQFFKKISMK